MKIIRTDSDGNQRLVRDKMERGEAIDVCADLQRKFPQYTYTVEDD